MAVRLREGTPARYDYRPVHFSQVVIEPGAPVLLTADPWGYLRAFLSQATEGYQTRHRKNVKRALHYVRLAEGFYAAMDGAHTRTSGVLAYYGMLNLVKSFLAYKDVELETIAEHHGLTVPLDSADKVRVQSAAGKGHVHIFHEFAGQLGTPVNGKHDVDFLAACSEVPELHHLMDDLGLLSGASPKFLPIKISFLVNERYDRLFAEIRYDKRQERLLPTSKFLRGNRQELFKEGVRQDDWIVHQTKKLRPVDKSSWPKVYTNLLGRLHGCDIVSMLGRGGYRYYCDLEPVEYHQLSYALMVMFFIGSISRYRPTDMEKTFVGLRRPVATEALALIPRQFLYQLTSLITGKLCVVPYADL